MALNALNDLHESGVTSGGIDPREVSAMDGNVWRPAHLMPEQLEERRLAAARLLRQGQLSPAEIARQLGVSRASVCRGAATLAQQGRRGLKARPIPGRTPRLDEKTWARLGRL